MRIFLDLDGVLINWSKGVCDLLKIDPYDPENYKILTSDQWLEGGKFGSSSDVEEAVQLAGYSFWEKLEIHPWAFDLINLCKSKGDLYFLTSASTFSVAAHAKIDFILRHFKSTKYIITSYKYTCASPNHFLIDDMLFNIKKWNEEGGRSFHFPNQWKLLNNQISIKETLHTLSRVLRNGN